MVKDEIIPMCQRIASRLEEDGDAFGAAVASSQINKLDALNAVAKDVLAFSARLKVKLSHFAVDYFASLQAKNDCVSS